MEWSELLVGWLAGCLFALLYSTIAFRSLSYIFFLSFFSFSLSFFPLFFVLFSPYYKQNGVLLLLLLLVARTKRVSGSENKNENM